MQLASNTPWGNSTDWNSIFGGQAGGSFFNPKPKPTAPAIQTSFTDPLTGQTVDTGGLREGASAGAATIQHGFAMDAQAEQRRQQALNAPWMSQLQGLLMQDANGTGLPEEALRAMFARGADSAAGTSRQATAGLSNSLGARGILPNSGLAAGLGSQIDMARGAATRGVERDVRVEALQRAAQQRASAFSNMLGLGNLQTNLTTYTPSYGNDALQGLTELIIQRQAQADAKKQGQKSSDNSLIGSIIGGVGGLLGGLL